MALPNSEKVTSQLATLPDQALKQMAMMHKADPYMLPLIISEDGRRKQMRQAAQAQMAQMAQPKVADADVAEMGIAQLPAPNMQHMADGGIAGYDDGGMTEGGGPASQLQFNNEPVVRMAGGGVTKMSGVDLFNKALDMEGITDPRERAFLKALHGQESSSKSSAPTSNRDARGAMQILPSTFKQVADKDMDIDKPLDNMRAGIRYGKKGYDAAGGDPVLAGAYYYGGPGGMQKAAKGVAVSDPENPKAPTTIDYGKSVAQRMTALLPIGSAVAGETPKQTAADTSMASQIPGQKYTAPEAQKPGGFLSSDWFERQAENLGLSRDVGRNVSNTLNAPTPLAPAAALPKTGGLFSGIASLGEKVGDKLGLLKGPAGRMSAAELAALKNEQSGIRALEAGQQATRGAQEAGATLEEQEYLRKMIEANRAKELPSTAEKIAQASQAREAQNVANAQRLSQVGQQAQTAGRSGAAADMIAPVPGSANAPTKPSVGADSGVYDREDMEEGAAKFEAPKAAEAVAVGKAAAPEGDKQGLTNDDYLTMGLNLLANRSRNLLTAVGEAGLKTAANKQAREKSEMEKAYMQAHGEAFRASAEQARANAAYLNSGVKGVGAVQKMANENYDNWLKAMEANPMLKMQLTPELAAQKQKEFLQKAYSAYKIDVPADVASSTSAPSSDPLGILSKKG